jgi:hypothetical protein
MLEWHFCWQVSLHSNSKWATIDKYVPVKLKPITKLIVKVMVHVDLLIDYCFIEAEFCHKDNRHQWLDGLYGDSVVIAAVDLMLYPTVCLNLF